LGTSFNVKAYEEDNQAVVTLFQGKVKTSVGRDEAFLLPDQAVTYLKNKGQLKNPH
jgi:transmembrane sensor